MDQNTFREIRTRLGFTQREWAKALGVGLSSVNAYEAGPEHHSGHAIPEPVARLAFFVAKNRGPL